MSGPYRFTQEEARSPLDRRPQNSFPAASQPVSFKTNVNRMKTKKWVEAKKNAYDGDDWGEYDEYDEYGAQQPPLQPAVPPAARGYGQRFDEQPARSFTDPQRQPPPQHGRRNSFEAGDEHRAFSSSAGPPPQGNPAYPPAPAPSQVHPALRQASGAESDVSDTPQHRRDFSPTAMPQPLQTRLPPAPGSSTGSPKTQFPPRKSSIGQTESPVAASPRERAPSNPGKPLPFVRPADIYRRVEEERQRERASMDSSRPSLDSLTREQTHEGADAGKSLQPLDTVAERKSEYLGDTSFQPSLPLVEGVSDFGRDFWPAASQQAQADVPSSSADDGFRTVVDQAFTRSDDQRSVPPTPITNDSGVSRSNTDSTSGISPIMSRVPSSALKGRNIAGPDSSTPVIAEETSETTTPVSGPTSAMLGDTHRVPRKPSPAHSRNVSSSSVPRTGLATPSPGESPARSPVIAPQAHVAEAESAQLASLSPSPPDAMEGGLNGPSPVYAHREADIATAMKNPGSATAQLRAAESESQAAFLESHSAQNVAENALPRSRSESPSKGRVQELAGRFGEVSSSRRGSTQSNASRRSVDSWERSQDNSRAPSPSKAGSTFKDGLAERPNPEREASFRPKLPGQWESYATSAATPHEQEKDLGADKRDNATSPLGEVDLTPTTSKHPVLSTDPTKPASDPLSALKAAGAAMGDAVMATVGTGTSKEDAHEKEYTHGDVLPRPLQLSRDSSSVSTVPPTPPAKDSPASEEQPPPPPLKEKSALRSPSAAEQGLERPSMVPKMSTDTAADDQESDRLRKEIVASLTPQRLSIAPPDPAQSSLQPHEPSKGRESSIFPSEYDSYWADGDRASPRPSHDIARVVSSSVEPGPGTTKSPTSPSKPSILTRFSWEEQQASLSAPSEPNQTPAAAAQETIKHEENLPSPTVEKAAKEGRDSSYAAFPDPYFGPAHSVASTVPGPISAEHVKEDVPTYPSDSTKPLASPTQTDADQNETPPVTGLHVVNSALNPEAVDMPPRLSREVSPIPQPAEASSPVHDNALHQQATEPGPPSPVQRQGLAAASPVSDKPLGSKDIATIKSSSERIANYNGTREYWARTDHGLSDWVSSVVTANPDLASQSYTPSKPALAHSATSRHKPTSSISLFGKHHGSNNPQATQSSAAPSEATHSPNSAPHGGGGRSASAQINLAKGKDFLHSAGVLGGKGMTGAKGLFAKGKSRFKSDKGSQSEASSREGSEEPEHMMPESLVRGSLDSAETFREEKKKRRFSSPFHRRSSRSRSRPSSIALPTNAHLDFGTPRNTPPRETPPAGSGSRPISFHAPDEWNVIPESQESSTSSKKSLQPPERLGVLPSPAKSQFSLVSHDREDDVPPIPPIPEGLDNTAKGRLSQESTSHMLLQSVIRNSTSPAPETPKAQGESTLTASASIKSKVVEDDVEAGHQETQAGVSAQSQDNADNADNALTASEAEVSASMDLANAERPTHEQDDEDRPPVVNLDPSPFDIPTATGDAAKTSSFSTPNNGKDVSSVLSSVGANRLADIEQDADKNLEPQHHNTLVPQLRLNIGDVSPMLSPARPAMDGSAQDAHAQWPPNDETPGPRDARPAFETELIGGDVSPVSLRNEEEVRTPTNEAPRLDGPATTAHPGNVVVKIIEPSDKAALAKSSMVAPPRAAEPTQVVHGQGLASRYHVLHAIQCAPSHSSLESWEQDSVAPSQSDGSQLGDRYDDPDVPPVPPVPSLAQQEVPANEQTPREAHPSTVPTLSSPTLIESTDVTRSEPESQKSHERMGSEKPQRSESLLSKISSMVSADGASISPVSSHGPRSSVPSSKRPPQPSSARNSPNPTPAQIMEEPATHVQTRTNAGIDDDFDLYADHNGIVKDIRDDRGQPLNVMHPAVGQSSPTTQFQASGPPTSQQSSQTEDETSTRYSDERPMSFVSGPPDVNGRPQDYINPPSPAPGGNRTPPSGLTSGKMPGKRLKGNSLGNIGPRQAPNLSQVENAEPDSQEGSREAPKVPNISPLNSQHGDNRTQPHSNVSSPPMSNASPPPQSATPPSFSQRPPVHGQTVTNGYTEHRPVDARPMQDPRQFTEAQMRGVGVVQRPPPGSWSQDQTYPPDPRVQGQNTGPPMGPRNQYELQQQMWQRQGMGPRDPRMWNGQQPNPIPGFPPSTPPPTKKGEKSSKPKFFSGLKAFGKSHGSAAHANSQQHPPAPQEALQPPMQPMFPAQAGNNLGEQTSPAPRQALQPPMQPAFPTQANTNLVQRASPATTDESNHRPSHQPNIGDLPEQVVRGAERPMPIHERPLSMGTVSHLSEDSTQAQAATSRLDLSYPESPAPFKGIPPQLPPPGAPGQPRPQAHRASTSGASEPGKKKRFSSFGNLFGRAGTTGHSVPSKAKLSKEEKKSQKPSKQPATPPIQPPTQQQLRMQPGHPWPQQQPPGIQYGGPRPFPGMHGNPPQPPQSTSPVPPQMMSPHGRPPFMGPPQGYFPPQQVQQQQQRQMQQHPQRQMQMQRPGPPSQENSAYLNSRRIMEERQAQSTPPAPLQFQSQPPSQIQDQQHQHPPQHPPQGQPQYPPQTPGRYLPQAQPQYPLQGQPQYPLQGQPQYPPQAQPQHMAQGHTQRLSQAQSQPLQQPQPQPEPQTQRQASQSPPQRQPQMQRPPQDYLQGPPQHQFQGLPQQQPQQQPRHQPPQHPQQQPLQQPPQQPQYQTQTQLQSSQPQAYVSRPGTQSPQSSLRQSVKPPENAPQAPLRAFPEPEPQPKQRQAQPTTFIMGIAQKRKPSQDSVERQQQQQQQQQQQLQMQQQVASRNLQQQRSVQPPPSEQGALQDSSGAIRSSSTPSPAQASESVSPVSQRRVSSPLAEPQYETPAIPAAYTHVSGAYVSPGTEEPPPFAQQGGPSPSQFTRQHSDPQMHPLSPQVSAMSQMPPNPRSHSTSSTVSAVSLVTGPPAGFPNTTAGSNQRLPRQRMSSITEQSNQERMWNLNLPHGATEQEIVRARQRQYMEQQLASQEQMHAERTGRSPSPRSPIHSQSSSPLPSQPPSQSHQPQPQNGGGFREVLPRSSPRPYSLAQSLQQNSPQDAENETRFSQTPPPFQGTSDQRDQDPQVTAYPPRLSPDTTVASSPVNADAKGLPPQPPPKVPHTPLHTNFTGLQAPPPSQQTIAERATQHPQPEPPLQEQHLAPANHGLQPGEVVHTPADTLQQMGEAYEQPPQHHPQNEYQHPQYDHQVPSDEPPPYSGPDMPNESTEKGRHRPPNIVTSNIDERGRHSDGRQRQVSIGMLQHPQPASMAASPQRSSADMGAESLRRQLLAQEERERLDQLQRAELRRAESERERQERDRARARARELERSVSGGGRVGSLRSAAGSTRTTTSGWERRGSTTRPVFELPAEEDDEPVMRATSFPGQEWVPNWTDD